MYVLLSLEPQHAPSLPFGGYPCKAVHLVFLALPFEIFQER